jgi:hypothetical protein
MLLKLNVDKYFKRKNGSNFKEKKKQKKKEEMVWAIAHTLSLRFWQA